MYPQSKVVAEFEIPMQKGASHKIELSVDAKNAYTISINPLQEIEDLQITESFAMDNFISAGSHWSSLVGWRSLFLLPFELDDTKHIVVGLEEPTARVSQNAYLKLIAFVYPSDDLDTICRNLTALHMELYSSDIDEDAFIKADIMTSASETFEDHLKVEKEILAQAVRYMKLNQKPILFRTIIFSQSHVHQIQTSEYKAIVSVSPYVYTEGLTLQNRIKPKRRRPCLLVLTFARRTFTFMLYFVSITIKQWLVQISNFVNPR